MLYVIRNSLPTHTKKEKETEEEIRGKAEMKANKGTQEFSRQQIRDPCRVVYQKIVNVYSPLCHLNPT